MTRYHIGFIIEQALGHVTHGKNLQANVPQDPEIVAHWGLPKWIKRGFASKIPIYKSNWTIQSGLQARRCVANMTREAEMDVLFFHTQVPAVLAQNWMRRIPSVVSLDATPKQYDSLGAFYAHTPGPAWLEKGKWKMSRNCFHTAKHLVTWSAWAKQGLVEEYGIPSEKITVIPPGVNVLQWRCPRARTAHNGPVKILFVGGNLERKGGHLLLEAFRTLRERDNGGHPAVELHLVTRDTVPAEDGLFVYNDMQPNSDRLKQLYFECDIFCLPTYGDCLPMVLSEAGAAGLPSISTRVAAIPEIVLDGETGFVIPAGDSSALTTALTCLVDDSELRLRLGKRAVQVVSERFDAKRNALKLLQLLKEVADESRNGEE